METLKLRNGSEEFGQMVAATMALIKKTCDEEPILFYELVMSARNRQHKFFGNAGERLKELGFLQHRDGSMHDSIRNVVLSSAEGEGFDLRLVSPVVNGQA